MLLYYWNLRGVPAKTVTVRPIRRGSMMYQRWRMIEHAFRDIKKVVIIGIYVYEYETSFNAL
tara:strand:+ start:14570 stop:14755 length:186 start_codon:yes stop_codon:yes gene_type:complete